MSLGDFHGPILPPSLSSFRVGCAATTQFRHRSLLASLARFSVLVPLPQSNGPFPATFLGVGVRPEQTQRGSFTSIDPVPRPSFRRPDSSAVVTPRGIRGEPAAAAVPSAGFDVSSGRRNPDDPTREAP